LSAQDADPCALGGITVTWNPVTSWGTKNDGSSCTTGSYEVERALASNPTVFTVVASGLTTTTYTDPTIIPNTDYVYRVNAVNGCCGLPTSSSATRTARDAVSAPPDFDGVQSVTDLDACNKTGVLIDWNPAASFGSPTGFYRVLRSPNIDCSSSTVIATNLSTTDYVDTTGSANTNYYYRVQAVSTCGATSDGGTGCLLGRDVQGIGAEPSAQDITPTVEPLKGVKAAGNAVTLTWEANSTLYNVYRGTIASLQSARYDHQQIGACDVGTDTATVDPGTGSFYYIVTGKPCAEGQESSYGRNSFDQERPNAQTASGNPCP